MRLYFKNGIIRERQSGAVRMEKYRYRGLATPILLIVTLGGEEEETPGS
jgi:hypothetical protein